MNREIDKVIAAIADRKPTIDLGPVDICFLIALHTRAASANLTSFTEQQLEDVFAQVSEIMQPEVEHVRRRATAAIHRLRDQRLLARVDGQGVVRTGEFALSRLATGIVEFFLEDDVLTRASLHVLIASLRSAISDVLASARAATEPAQWAEGVVGPLQVTIAELVAGIERRQRGLDIQQENFQAEIRRLLEADWFGALDRCQALLESTSATLHELNEMLLRDSSELLGLLHDIEEQAVGAGEVEAENVAHRLMDQIDRSVAWGTSRQRAWSEYFQYVHRYLRDVVRLDPTRALTQRLRDQLAGSGGGTTFSLAYASAQPMQILRTAVPAIEKPPVVRPRAPRDREPATEAAEDPQAALSEKVRRALDEGARTLSAVTSQVTGELPASDRFIEAGRVAHTVAQLARVTAEVERPWIAVGEDLEVEEWETTGPREDKS